MLLHSGKCMGRHDAASTTRQVVAGISFDGVHVLIPTDVDIYTAYRAVLTKSLTLRLYPNGPYLF